MATVKTLWEKLIRPANRLTDVEERANSRLLSSLLIIFFPVGIFVSTIPYLFGSELALSDDLDFVIIASSSILWLIAYGLNRLGYFKASVLFVIVIAGIVIFTEVILDSDPEDLVYLLLPLLVISTFFPLRYVLVIFALDLGSIFLLPFFVPKFNLEDVLSSPISFMFFGGLLLIITKIHAVYLEKKRKKQLEASELRYSLIAEAANDGLWDWDLKTNTVYYSPRWKEMIGYADNEIGDTSFEWIERIHPDDLEMSIQKLSNFGSGRVEVMI